MISVLNAGVKHGTLMKSNAYAFSSASERLVPLQPTVLLADVFAKRDSHQLDRARRRLAIFAGPSTSLESLCDESTG